MDDYQAVYDAVRSRISDVNIGTSFESVLRECFGMADHRIQCAMEDIKYEYCRPCYVLKPKISIDGDQWCALYGQNLQDGIAGFGDSVAEAFSDFDKNYRAKLVEK